MERRSLVGYSYTDRRSLRRNAGGSGEGKRYQKKPKEQRWDIGVIKDIKGLPWDPCGLGNTEVPVHIDIGIEGLARPAVGSELEQAARNLYG